jgi:hypothetical protein
MIRSPFRVRAALSIACAMASGSLALAAEDTPESREIPAAFAPFEYLVGQWKGQGIPKDKSAEQFRGWTETHSWAWMFQKGKPSGLSVTIEGGKLLASGKVSFDPARKLYRLEGTGPKPSGEAIAFEGKLDASGKQLLLERVAPRGEPAGDAGAIRVSIRPNGNFIRYTMTEERKSPGAVQYSKVFEINAGKVGETFAAGSAATERPKCIVTGGAATMTVSFEGQTFQVCCSGCVGEFNDNPQKYVKKAALLLSNSQAGKGRQGQPAPRRVRGRDDAFAGDVVESDAPITPVAKAKQKESAPTEKVAKAGADAREAAETDKPKDNPAPKKKAAAQTPAAKAATLLRLGRALERSGKTDAALINYREIVKDYASTPSAKTAAERIKAIEKE